MDAGGRPPFVALTGREYGVHVAVEAARSAFESLGEGDVEPLVALIHPDMEWRGRRRLTRFWKPPS